MTVAAAHLGLSDSAEGDDRLPRELRAIVAATEWINLSRLNAESLRFHARDVHLVMGPPRSGKSVRFRVTIDGHPPGAARGLDVNEGGTGTASEQRLYQLIRQPNPIADRTFAIEFLDPGVEAFSFTFG